jgi:hypothetical protein
MTFKNFSFAFAIALGVTAAGCATDPAPGGGGGGGGGGGDGSGSGSDVPKTLDATGKYQVRSTFDIASNMPGTVGTVVNGFIAATDGPDDPTRWILDQVIAQMPGGFLKTALQSAEPFVAGYLNDRLLAIAPDFVTTMVLLGNDFGDMAKHFGLNETFDVAKSGTGYNSTNTVFGAHFKFDTLETDVAFADYQVANVVASNVAVTMDNTGKLTIAEHKLPLAYGKILRIGLDAVIIPMIDSNATNLGQLLNDKVDCQAVGANIAAAIGFGGTSTYAAACVAGLNFGANAIYQKITAIDASALEFGLTGTAKGVDTNQDSKLDKIQTGAWAGTLSYAGSPAPLAAATFNGSRM